MSPLDRISDELGPYVEDDEAEPIDRMGRRLTEKRPAPPPSFRRELRDSLAAEGDISRPTGPEPETGPEEIPATAPQRLGLLAGAYVSSGLVLLAVAALGLAGAGPLAP
jgi:hypothetical protein